MTPGDDPIDLKSETTEQALARVEAECGWSDVRRFADVLPPVQAAPAPAGDREPR